MDFIKIIKKSIESKASDIHLQTGEKPIIRINGKLSKMEEETAVELRQDTPELKKIMTADQMDYFTKNGNVDFAFSYDANHRLRGNLYRQAKGLSLSLRIISNKILTFEELGLPPIFKDMSENYHQGFFLIVGPTGHGKSTSLASVLSYINKNNEKHIITIEDPIEYIIKNEKSVIEQREVGIHTSSFQNALRAAMRQDPDIIIIGEMRDQETMQAALTLAETGHLVFSTMHTNNSVQSIDRIIDAFPEERQKQIRIQLAATLTGVMSQRLIPGVDGGLVYAYEQLVVNDAIRNIIRSEKTEHIYNALQGDDGDSMRLEQCLAKLLKAKKITEADARNFAGNHELLDMYIEY